MAIFFGGNDWDAGMRGEEFARACEDAVDRVRRATGGKADILLITTNPTVTRWTETAEMAEACRRAARSRNCGSPIRKRPSTRLAASTGIGFMLTTGCTWGGPGMRSSPRPC